MYCNNFTFFCYNYLYSRRGNTKASGREVAELAMEGVVEGDGMAEGNDNMNNILPSTSSSISTNAPDMATSSSTTSNTNPSSSGTQATGGGVNCNFFKSVYYEPQYMSHNNLYYIYLRAYSME